MNTVSILCIGDSHTAGFPDYDPLMGGDPESSYQFWLTKALMNINSTVKYQLINEGMCGDTSRGIVHRLFQSLKINSYNLVILAGGTNDLGLSNGEQVFHNLKHGYETCLRQHIPVIAPSIPPISLTEYVRHIKAVNSAILSYTAQNQCIVFADWFSALKDERGFLTDTYNSGDGIHLSIAGYKCIGALLAPLVKLLSTGY